MAGLSSLTAPTYLDTNLEVVHYYQEEESEEEDDDDYQVSCVVMVTRSG